MRRAGYGQLTLNGIGRRGVTDGPRCTCDQIEPGRLCDYHRELDLRAIERIKRETPWLARRLAADDTGVVIEPWS